MTIGPESAPSNPVVPTAPATAPVFTADTPPTAAAIGILYPTYTFAASGSPAPTFAVATGALPPGLSLNSTTGALSGTPTKTGSFTFKIVATNGTTPNATSPSITIKVSRQAPRFTAAKPPTTGAAGVPYASYTFTASGAPPPSFSVAAGSLPTGITLNSATGLLTGTPTKTGTFTFKIMASNGVLPNATTAAITIKIAR